MSKPEITVTCVFPDKGEMACQILFRSFRFFLQRELTRDGHELAIPRYHMYDIHDEWPLIFGGAKCTWK